MPTYIVTPFDGDPDDWFALVVDEDKAQDILAEFFAHPETKDGMGVLIRRADYMGKPADIDYAGIELRVAAHLNDWPTRHPDFVVHGSMTGRIPRQPGPSI